MDRARPRPVVGPRSRARRRQSLRARRPALSRVARRQRFGPLPTKRPSCACARHLHLPLLLALWTGQRQGDLLRLPWSATTARTSGCGSRKTGKPVVILVGAPLKAALDAAPKRSPIILTNSEGKPWTSDGFRASWRQGMRGRGRRGVTFHDLRGTAVTRLALVGATEAEIATITGHSLRTCTRSSTCTISRAIRRSARAPSASSKGNKTSQLSSQLVPDVLSGRRKKRSEINGGRTRTRTLDPLIKSQLLYQLSYAPARPERTARVLSKQAAPCPETSST